MSQNRILLLIFPTQGSVMFGNKVSLPNSSVNAGGELIKL